MTLAAWRILVGVWGGFLLTAGLGAQEALSVPGLLVSGKTFVETGGVYTGEGAAPGVAAEAGAVVTLTNAEVSAAGAPAGVLVSPGGRLTLTGGSVRTSGTGCPGLFAAGAGAIVAAAGTSVTTLGPQSPGLQAAPGGSLTVTRGTLRTAGAGSAAITAAGAVRVAASVLVAPEAEAAIVEGSPGVVLDNTTLVGGRQGVLFRSGGGTFSMTGGSLTAVQGPLFAVEAPGVTVTVKEAVLVQNSGRLVWLTGNPGGTATLNADHQTLAGDVAGTVGGALVVNLRNGSRWTGAADPGSTGASVAVVLDSTSLWTVTADSTVTTLSVSGGDVAEAVRSIAGGHRVRYQASANSWLGGRTVALSDGGSLVPY